MASRFLATALRTFNRASGKFQSSIVPFSTFDESAGERMEGGKMKEI